MNNFILHLYVGMDGVTEAQREQIRGILAHHFKGYTESSTQGGWHDGQRLQVEPAMKWEIITQPLTETSARAYASDIAGAIRVLAQQQAVLYTLSPVISGMSEAQS